ncbi:9362_t:CDS:2, partial [Funneliformis geosporum]
MFETIISEYLDTTLHKDWSVLEILKSALPELSVDTFKEFKDDLYAVLQRYSKKCNIHAHARNKVKKILSNFDTNLSTVEVRKYINELELRAEMRVNVTSAYTVEVLKDQRQNREIISQLRRNDSITGENSKEADHVREKVTRPSETQDDHSYKRQRRDELQMPEYPTEVADDDPPIEWEFDTLRPSWLEKVVEERRILFSNNDLTARYESSLKIVDLSDPKTLDILSETELSDLSAIFSSSLKNWTVLDPATERCLQSLTKLNSDQLRMIGEIVRPKGTYGAILELQEMLKDIKKQTISEPDDLFDDEDTFDNEHDISANEETPLLALEDHLNPDVAYTFDLIRVHLIVQNLITGEAVSRASRDRRAEATDAPTNTEGYHFDWMFTKHNLGTNLSWGREFSLCERTGSKIEDKPKILSNTLKVQKTLRDMHQTLIKTISIEGGGMLSKPVLRASSKLLMPGFLSSYFFMRAILIIYVGEGYYSSLNLADFDIPTKYEELEYTIRISRIMLQVKRLLSTTISQFKRMKERAEKEKLTLGRVAVHDRKKEYRSPQKPKKQSSKGTTYSGNQQRHGRSSFEDGSGSTRLDVGSDDFLFSQQNMETIPSGPFCKQTQHPVTEPMDEPSWP